MQNNPLTAAQKKAMKKALQLSNYAKKFFVQDGEVQSKVYGICNPLPEQWVMAEEVLRLLNSRRIEWNGGNFRVVLTKVKESYRDPLSNVFLRYVPTLFEVQFCDMDGDVQFVIEYPDNAIVIMNDIGCSRICDEAEDAYNQWRKFIGAIDIIPSETYKAAQGEKPITGIDAPPSMVSGA